MTRIFTPIAAATLAAMTIAGTASAATIFTDRASWLAAVSGVTTTDFEENGAGLYTSYGSTYSGVGFTISGSGLFTVDPGFAAYYDWNSGDVLDFETNSGSIAAGANFGFDYGNPAGFFGSGSVTIGGNSYTLIGQPTFNFFGVVGATGPVTIDFSGGLGIVDNFSVATGGAVPEPTTWAMLIAGFGLTGAIMRRRRTAFSRA